MAPIILLICFIILSYAGVFLIFRRKRLSLLVGMEYLLIGFLFSLVDVKTDLLRPLLYPLLGWIGLLTGSQLKLTHIRRLGTNLYFSVAGFTAALGITCFCLLRTVSDVPHSMLIAIALIPVSYRIVAQFVKDDRFVLFFVSVLPFVCTLLLFCFYCIAYAREALYLMIVFTIGYSIIARFILTHIDEKASINLIIIGLIILISESCALMNLSPLLVTFFVGIYLANFCHVSDRVFTILYSDEKPLYTMFLLMTGMLAGFNAQARVIVQGLMMVLVVVSLKYVLVRITSFRLSPHCWFYFLAPGGFSITVAVDYWLFEGARQQTVWLSSFLLCVLLLQFFSVLMSKSYDR